MLLSRAAALLGVLFCLACTVPSDTRMHTPRVGPPADPREETVLVDDAFEAPDQRAALEGVAAWNRALAGTLRLDPHVASLSLSEHAILILRAPEGADYIPTPVTPTGYDGPPARALAFAKPAERRLWLVRERMAPSDVTPIVMHELGHILGAPDRYEGAGLMFWRFDPAGYACVDKETAASVASAQLLPLEAMAYCERVPRGAPTVAPEDELTAYPPLRL